MLLRNTKSCLITINGKQDKNGERDSEFKILPGNNPPVEVPDELCNIDFVKALIADGALMVLAQPAPEINGDYASLDKAALRDLCELRDIACELRDSKDLLIKKLES
jgi:hypothetical protein